MVEGQRSNNRQRPATERPQRPLGPFFVDGAVEAGEAPPQQHIEVIDQTLTGHRPVLEPPVTGELDHPDHSVGPRQRSSGINAETSELLTENHCNFFGNLPDELRHGLSRLGTLAYGAVHQEPVGLWLRFDEHQVRVDGRSDPPMGIVRAPESGTEVIHKRAYVELGDCLIEATLVPEVLVKDRFSDTRLRSDLGHRNEGAATTDRTIGRAEELASPLRAPGVPRGIGASTAS